MIGLVPGQIVTDALVEELHAEDGHALADPERDLAKIAVIERHLGTGRIGLGFVRGFGLQRGALASTFSHDAHNLVVVGMSDDDMARAVARLAELGGGLVVVDGGTVTAELPLPVAGLLSDRPLARRDRGERGDRGGRARARLEVESPFQSLAFLALSVIPSLKITDRGLVDVDRFELVPLRRTRLARGLDERGSPGYTEVRELALHRAARLRGRRRDRGRVAARGRGSSSRIGRRGAATRERQRRKANLKLVRSEEEEFAAERPARPRRAADDRGAATGAS